MSTSDQNVRSVQSAVDTSGQAVRTAQTDTEAHIRQLLADQAAAMQARDADCLVSRYTPDAVTFGLAPPLQAGAQDAKSLSNWFAGFDGPIEYEIRDVSVTAGEDVAFCHSLNRLSTAPRGMPQKFNLWFRATLCLRKVEGKWLISHEHNSTPFYMDGSLRAAVDLQP